MKKRWYFTLMRGAGKSNVEFFLDRRNKKFVVTHALHTSQLLNFFQAHWLWLQFNLPGWMHRNGSMFHYAKVHGRVFLRRLNNEMLQ